MRYAVLILCACSTLSAQSVQLPPSLDEPMRGAVRVTNLTGRPPCELWTALEQLARQAQVRIGFEHTLDRGPAPWSGWANGNSVSLDGLTARQAFDRVLSHRPDYRWAEVDGVVVIRPATAWAPGGSVLNRPVGTFALVDDHPHHALHAMFQSATPSLFQEHTDLHLSSSFQRLNDPQATAPIDAPISVGFAGGAAARP